jgi:toxin FitB
MIVLDTNVVSGLMQAEKGVIGWLDRQPRLSIWTTAITVLEVRFGLQIMPPGRRQADREAAFERLLSENLQGRILALDQRSAEETATIMAARQRAGTRRDLRDSMIAGIVLAQRATLATRNVRHFDDLDVPVVDPWRD